MRIKFLGTGSAFSLNNYQTNIALEHGGKWLLLDAGGDIRFSLRDAGLSYKDIDGVYISHLHTDHAGGIEYVGFSSYFDPSITKKIKLYGNGELLRRGWENTWKGGLESIQGKLLDLDDFFDVQMIKSNGKFRWGGAECNIVQSVHIMNGYSIVLCFGLMIKTASKTIFWTADTQYAPNQIMDFYGQADFIIQDCETGFKSGVHAHFSDLEGLPEEVKKKMILVHYQDNVLDIDKKDSSNIPGINSEWKKRATDAGFIGFAERLQEYHLERLPDSLLK